MADDGDRCVKCGTRVQIGGHADFADIPGVGRMCHDCDLANRWWNQKHRTIESPLI